MTAKQPCKWVPARELLAGGPVLTGDGCHGVLQHDTDHLSRHEAAAMALAACHEAAATALAARSTALLKLNTNHAALQVLGTRNTVPETVLAAKTIKGARPVAVPCCVRHELRTPDCGP